ncbi:MAG: ATP-dependent Clp protease ATP-binding subunit [Bacilli bacterium]|nr:ATP-dependent Clp protease ATP-binding subunit [Bacilli bacterium]
MKFYDAEKLFIGNVGYARTIYKDNKQYIRFYGERIAITKQDSFHLDYYYFDVCSKKKYTDFYSPWCGNGDSAIFEPCSLALSIKQNFKNDQQIDDIPKVVKKILKDKKISNKDIKEFVFLLNNRMMVKNNQYNLESDKSYNNENIIKNNNNINTNYSTLLTEKVFKNEPAIGRDDEVNELIVALAQDKKSPVLVGPSGTGKTTIVDQLAYRIQQNNVPEFLKNKKIIEIDLISLLSGTKYSGTLQDKITNLINIATKENALIFIDEIHTTYGAGTHDKSDYDVAAMIKQAIDRQGLKVIGTTTTEEYEKYFSNDS